MTKDSDPLVSIIIPCFNAEKYIHESISSALNQSYKNVEIIVINDGSTDNSLKEIEKFGDKIKIFSVQNNGQSYAENIGLKKASGKYIKFFDSDDILHEKAIENQIIQIESHDYNERIVVFGNKVDIDERGLLIKKVNTSFNIKNEEIVDLNYLLLQGIITGSPLHKKYLLDEIGGWDHYCPIMGNDFDLIVRLSAVGVKFKYYDSKIYYYRVYNSMNRSSSRGWIDKDPQLLIYLYTKWARILNNHTSFDDSLKLILAQKHIDIGRKMVLIEKYDHAKIHFLMAKDLANRQLKLNSHLQVSKKGNLVGYVYLFVIKHFDNINAEKMYSYSKRCLSFFSHKFKKV